MKTLEQRFNEKWIPVPESGCWLWIGAVNGNGYGSMTVDRKHASAHRISYTLSNGDIPESDSYHGTVVRHKCDNKLCVNPSHLEIGCQKENVRDMDVRNRRANNAGEKHGRAKLTEADVIAIRKDDRRYKEIASSYSISFVTVSEIKRNIKWRHIL